MPKGEIRASASFFKLPPVPPTLISLRAGCGRKFFEIDTESWEWATEDFASRSYSG